METKEVALNIIAHAKKIDWEYAFEKVDHIPFFHLRCRRGRSWLCASFYYLRRFYTTEKWAHNLFFTSTT